MNPKCSKCGGDTKFMSKTAEQSKSGKAWSANICQNKACNNFDFIRDNAPKNGNGTTAPKPYQPRQLPNDPNRLNDKDKAFGQAKGAAFNKSCDVVIAGFNKDLFTYEEIPQRVEEMFQALVKINAGDDVA